MRCYIFARSPRAAILRRGAMAFVLPLLSPILPLLSAADTFQDFSANFPVPPPPYELSLTENASLQPGSINGGPSVSYLRLTQDEVALNGQAGIRQAPSNIGAYESLKFDFDFRINDPATGADGFSFAYLPVSTYGTNGPAPNIGEEPNAAGVLGIGFDTWNNGDIDDNNPGQGEGSLPDSLSIHWNGAIIGQSLDMPAAGLPVAWLENDVAKHASITITPSGGDSLINLLVTEPSTGLSASLSRTAVGMSPYDGRVGFSGRVGGENQNQLIDNLSSTFDPAGATPAFTTVLSNFDNPPPSPPPPPTLLGGTPYAAQQHGGAPAGSIQPEFPPSVGGDAPGLYQLTDNVGGTINSIAFDKTIQTMTPGGTLRVGFDIRVTNTNAATADGMSFMLLNTATYGATGPLPVPTNVSEDPNNPGMIALGFDTFDNDEDFAAGDPTGCGGGGPCTDRLANSISAHVNGVQVDQQFIGNGITYNSGHWLHIDQTISLVDDGSGGLAGLMDVLVTDLNTGDTFLAFSGLGLASIGADVRLAFGARTGGEFDFQALDNVFATYEAVPEPGSLVLLGIGAIGLLAVRRRRRRKQS